jgi:hypothetical protein
MEPPRWNDAGSREPAPENSVSLLTHDSQLSTAARIFGFEVMGMDQSRKEWNLVAAFFFPTCGATDPIVWPTTVASYRQDE